MSMYLSGGRDRLCYVEFFTFVERASCSVDDGIARERSQGLSRDESYTGAGVLNDNLIIMIINMHTCTSSHVPAQGPGRSWIAFLPFRALFEHTCVYARQALMHGFLSVCDLR